MSISKNALGSSIHGDIMPNILPMFYRMDNPFPCYRKTAEIKIHVLIYGFIHAPKPYYIWDPKYTAILAVIHR